MYETTLFLLFRIEYISRIHFAEKENFRSNDSKYNLREVPIHSTY